MNAIIKQLFYVDDNEQQRISLTKTGANVQIVGGLFGGAATSLLASGHSKLATVSGGVAATLIFIGKGIAEIGKRNAMK